MNFSEWRNQQKLKESINLFKFPAHQITPKEFDKIVSTFIAYAKKYLRLKTTPKIKFVKDAKFASRVNAFGQINGKNNITIDILERHPMDILRTLSHELVHLHQHEKGKNGSGYAGSDTENEANVIAGIMLRKFGADHSELFAASSIKEEAKKKAKRIVKTDRDYEHYPMELT